jgi:hypothetical protein
MNSVNLSKIEEYSVHYKTGENFTKNTKFNETMTILGKFEASDIIASHSKSIVNEDNK